MISAASEKYHVIMASRNPENGQKAVEQVQALEATRGTVSTVQLDQTDEASIKRAVEEVSKQFGRLDVLVNNAALAVGTYSFWDELRTDICRW